MMYPLDIDEWDPVDEEYTRTAYQILGGYRLQKERHGIHEHVFRLAPAAIERLGLRAWYSDPHRAWSDLRRKTGECAQCREIGAAGAVPLHWSISFPVRARTGGGVRELCDECYYARPGAAHSEHANTIGVSVDPWSLGIDLNNFRLELQCDNPGDRYSWNFDDNARRLMFRTGWIDFSPNGERPRAQRWGHNSYLPDVHPHRPYLHSDGLARIYGVYAGRRFYFVTNNPARWLSFCDHGGASDDIRCHRRLDGADALMQAMMRRISQTLAPAGAA